MLIIDSAREIKVGVAPHFPPVTLGDAEVMMNQELFDYLSLEESDPAVVEIQVPSISADYYMKMLGMITANLENPPQFDLYNKVISLPETDQHPALNITMSDIFGDNEDKQYLKLPSTLKKGFEESYGKFPVAYGNVVILDCHYILNNILDATIVMIEPLRKKDLQKYLQIVAGIKALEGSLK